MSLGREHMLSYAILRSTSWSCGRLRVATRRRLPLAVAENRTKQKMEIDTNKWKSIRTNGNRSEQMEIEPNNWKSVRTLGNRSMEIDPKWKSNQTNGNRSEQMEIDPNQWKSVRTTGNRTEQIMEIGPNKVKSNQSMENQSPWHGGSL